METTIHKRDEPIVALLCEIMDATPGGGAEAAGAALSAKAELTLPSSRK